MRATLRSLTLEPDPRSLPADPAQFVMQARMLIGPSDGPGEESFDFTLCSPEWLAARAAVDGFLDGRHHVIVNLADFDEGKLRSWLDRRVTSVQAEDWRGVGERLSRLGCWEFEDYTA